MASVIDTGLTTVSNWVYVLD